MNFKIVRVLYTDAEQLTKIRFALKLAPTWLNVFKGALVSTELDLF